MALPVMSDDDAMISLDAALRREADALRLVVDLRIRLDVAGRLCRELNRQNSDLQKANVRLEERARRWEWASKGIVVADANMSELLKRAYEFVKHAEWWATGDQAQRFREKLDAVGLAKEIEAELGIRNNVRS